MAGEPGPLDDAPGSARVPLSEKSLCHAMGNGRFNVMATIQESVRIRSIDAARGAVMVLMALDHVRVYSGIPAGGPTPGLFLTRWITNFCAPAFVFFAGCSIFLHGQRLGDRADLSRWLMVRGAWLVLLELTFLRVAWTFNVDFAHYMLAGVIWMLGWCMILMALLVYLPLAANAILGVAVIAGHNLVAVAISGSRQSLLQGNLGWLWRVLYFGGGIVIGGGSEPNFWVLYSIVPWIGVMAAGYVFGAVLRMSHERRRLACYAIGGGATAAFLIVQFLYVDHDQRGRPDPPVPIWISFLTATKYPASLLFLLMTLGPTIAVLPMLERAQGQVARWLTVFGRVPLFYYVLHIPLIHLVAVGISLLRSPAATLWLFGNHPTNPGAPPEGYTWSLGLLYLVTAAIVGVLYVPCRWFAQLKARRTNAWLSFL
jgi:uncharacterized membrane protein